MATGRKVVQVSPETAAKLHPETYSGKMRKLREAKETPFERADREATKRRNALKRDAERFRLEAEALQADIDEAYRDYQ